MTSAQFPDLAGKSVYITGGGSGIGAVLTDAFMAQGARVAFVQRSDASAFVAEMEAKHGQAPHFMACDITDIDRLKATIAEAADQHGPINVLINNAANDQRHDTLEVDEAYWDWCQSINLKPYFFAAQAVIPGMQAMGGGVIINFSSISYMMGNGAYPGYTAANAAITGLTRSLARDFGPDHIRVNAIAPGWTLTQKQRDLWVTPEGLKAHMDRQCIPDELLPEDIAGPCLFLASDAARMLTSQVIAVDGGVVVSG